MCHGKMENFADVATLEGVWFSDQCEQWHITPPPIITMCHCLFLFLFLLVVHEWNGRTFWKCEEEEMSTPREGGKKFGKVKLAKSWYAENIRCCSVMLCCVSVWLVNLGSIKAFGVASPFTLPSQDDGGPPRLQPPTGFSVDFFILNLKQNISSFTINYGEEPRRSWRIVIVFKCEFTCWTVKEQIRTYSLTCIKQSQ